MDPGRIPKDLLYGELAEGARPTGRPHLRYKDVCERDLKQCSIVVANWESLAKDRASWRSTVKCGVREGELLRNEAIA